MEIVVLLRPRRGDFIYDADEKAVLLDDLGAFVELGVQSFAIGALRAEGELDVDFLAELSQAAGPAKLTCHRAFDHVARPLVAMEQLIELGFKRLLTSGQAASAPQGAALIAELVERAAGRLELIAAAGVRPENVAALVQRSKVPSVHLSASREQASPMQMSNIRATMGTGEVSDEFVRRITDESVVRSCRIALS